MENKIFIDIVKKRINNLICLIIFLIVILIIIFISSIHSIGDRENLSNTLSNQYALILKITKDANRKMVILNEITNDHVVKEDEKLYKRLDTINQRLKYNILLFENRVQSIYSDNIYFDNAYYNNKIVKLLNPEFVTDSEQYINDLKWKEFSNAVDVIIDNNVNNNEIQIAIDFINIGSGDIADDWNSLSINILNGQKLYSHINLAIMIIIFISIVIILLLAIYQLNAYLIEPLGVLYNGLSSYNLIHDKNKDNKKLSTKNDLAIVVNEINSRFNKLSKLIELTENLNRDVSFDGILNYIYCNFSDFIPYNHIGIALFSGDSDTLEASYGISDKSVEDVSLKMVGIKVKLNDTSLIKVVNNGMPRVVNDYDIFIKNKKAVYNNIIIDAGIKSSITLPLITNGKTVGIIFFSSLYKNIYKPEHVKFLETLSSSIALSFNKNIFIDELLYSTLIALVKMAEARDEDTGEHLDRIKAYSLKTAECLLEDGIYEDEITISFLKDIERFSPMHDIGKVGVRDGILLKQGKLNFEEFEIMKKHAIYGGEILRAAESNINKQNQSMFKMGIEIAEGHHEKWDGSGYPNKQSGNNIPLSARIVAVGDVFDALTSKRPYKQPLSFDESFNIIVQERGIHFDPNIVDCFVRHKNEIYKLYSENQLILSENMEECI